MKFLYFLFFSFASSLSNAQTFTGKVAMWFGAEHIIRQVNLVTDGGAVLSNSNLWIKNLPVTVVADKNGCFCFDENDERFVYINAFYYGNRQITFYNQILREIGVDKLPRLPINLQKLTGIAPSGSAGNGNVSVTFATPLLDPSILAHEIGHEIHHHMMGMTYQDWSKKYESEQTVIRFQQGGVLEGAANILAALWLRNSQIGFASYFDVASDVSQYVIYPVVQDYTVGGVIEKKVSSEIFELNYPKTVMGLRNALDDPSLKEILIQPDPYWASALINQPVWFAAHLFGRERIIELYLQSLRSFANFKTYRDLAAQITISAAKEPRIQRFLEDEFSKRGIGSN